MRKVIGGVVVAILLLWLFSAPESLAGFLKGIADGLVRFVGALA